MPLKITHLKDDEILNKEKNIIVTKWNAINPKIDLAKGYSYYFLDQNYKISKFIDHNNNFLYYYCDIVSYELDKNKDTLIYTDLLIDIIVHTNFNYKVLDMDELTLCYKQNGITISQMLLAIDTTQRLLDKIYSGEFANIIKVL